MEELPDKISGFPRGRKAGSMPDFPSFLILTRGLFVRRGASRYKEK